MFEEPKSCYIIPRFVTDRVQITNNFLLRQTKTRTKEKKTEKTTDLHRPTYLKEIHIIETTVEEYGDWIEYDYLASPPRPVHLLLLKGGDINKGPREVGGWRLEVGGRGRLLSAYDFRHEDYADLSDSAAHKSKH